MNDDRKTERSALADPQIKSMPYVIEAARVVDESLLVAGFDLDDCDKQLVSLYALLCLGTEPITRNAVHDAWALWKAGEDVEHPCLIRYDELPVDKQFLDEAFRVALMFARDEMTIRGIRR